MPCVRQTAHLRCLAAGLALFAHALCADMIDDSSMEPWEVCALCHSLDGNSAMAKFPKLAGQKPEYIAQQIEDFRTGRRTNDGGQMQAIVAELDEADIPRVASWFASQTPPAPTIDAPDTSSVADMVNATDNQACVRCHNSDTPYAPHLNAQHADYLAKQLNDFLQKERLRGSEIHIMLGQLSAAQRSVLARYFASQAR